jgi:hypothetical protein
MAVHERNAPPFDGAAHRSAVMNLGFAVSGEPAHSNRLPPVQPFDLLRELGECHHFRRVHVVHALEGSSFTGGLTERVQALVLARHAIAELEPRAPSTWRSGRRDRACGRHDPAADHDARPHAAKIVRPFLPRLSDGRDDTECSRENGEAS